MAATAALHAASQAQADPIAFLAQLADLPPEVWSPAAACHSRVLAVSIRAANLVALASIRTPLHRGELAVECP